MKIWAGAAISVISVVTCSAGAQELSYRLPKTTIVAGWQARITRCPSPVQPEFAYTTNVTIAGAPGPGELVRLNPSSPFLGSRKIALSYFDDGTIKTINAEGEGQGGAVVASLLKTAAGFFALGVPIPAMPRPASNSGRPAPTGVGTPTPTPPPARPKVVCRSDVEDLVSQWRRASDAIDAIESDVASGRQLGAVRTSVYEDLKKEQAEYEDALTLSTSVKITRSRSQTLARQGAGGGYSEVHAIEPIGLDKWLVADAGTSLPELKTGQYGFCARFSASKEAFDEAAPIETPAIMEWRRKYLTNGTLNSKERLNRFVYLSPVPVSVEFWMRASAGSNCSSQGRMLTRKSLLVPQLSEYFILPLGSGAFESKSTSGEFTAGGGLVNLGTSGTGGGAQFAEALAGGLTAATSLNDARTDAIQRRVDRIKAENELNQLREPSDNSKVLEPG